MTAIHVELKMITNEQETKDAAFKCIQELSLYAACSAHVREAGTPSAAKQDI